MKLKRIAGLIVVVISLLSAACRSASDSPAATLTVFAAASLTDAFSDLAAAFSAEQDDVAVVFNFAGSNQLATQIAQGAPADVFASADEAQMAAAVISDRIERGEVRPFASNRLVIIYPTDNPAGISEPRDLAQDGLLLILPAPEVPAGAYALDFLAKAALDPAYGPDFPGAVLANLVSSEQNVRAVLTKVVLGEADAGIVYASDAASASESVGRLEIPDSLSLTAGYPIAVLNDSPQAEMAQAFVEFVLSPAGQDILARHGFLPPETP